ncbi:MAG: adenosylmethionine-8-amino-7-oxononanoate aminotransferase [Pirellula sp.]
MAEKIQGTVVEVSTDGDLITDISQEKWGVVSRSSETKVIVDEEHETYGLFAPEHNQPPMTLIAIIEPSKPLRLHLVSDSASMMLGVRQGAKVEIVW